MNVSNPNGAVPTPCPNLINYEAVKAGYMADLTTSDWLNDAIKTLEQRDPVDALSDLEALQRLAQLRLQDIVKGAPQ